MGLLTCPRCNAKTNADSIDEGRKRLDHAIGIYIGMPCEDGKVELIFTGKEIKSKDTKSDKKSTTSKK